jgi:hypothetical protein
MMSNGYSVTRIVKLVMPADPERLAGSRMPLPACLPAAQAQLRSVSRPSEQALKQPTGKRTAQVASRNTLNCENVRPEGLEPPTDRVALGYLWKSLDVPKGVT